ncbi:hypothetical protein B484DRAFT_406090, partial [Ochromonadaceae sp. CCMP2298]
KNALSGELSGELSVEAGEAGEGEAVVKTESASAGVRVRVGGGLGVCGTPPAVMVDGVDMSMSEDGEGGDIISCLDAASASVVDAALRLHGQQPTSSSPNLFSITSWLHTQQLHQDEQAKGGERESKTESEAHKGKGEKGEEGSPVVAPRSAGSPPGNTVHFHCTMDSVLHYYSTMDSVLHYHSIMDSVLHFHSTMDSVLHFHSTMDSVLHFHSTMDSVLHFHSTMDSSAVYGFCIGDLLHCGTTR